MSKGKMPPQLLEYFKKKQGKAEDKKDDKPDDKVKKEDKRNRTNDKLFDEIMNQEHKKQMQLKGTNGLTKE